MLLISLVKTDPPRVLNKLNDSVRGLAASNLQVNVSVCGEEEWGVGNLKPSAGSRKRACMALIF